VLLCALSAIAFGLVPALRATRLSLTASLKDGTAGGGSRASLGSVDARSLIVSIETALSIVLLVSGGLPAADLRPLSSTRTGFDQSHLLAFWIRPSETRYPVDKASALIEKVLREIEQLPGVEAATVDGCAPVGPGCASSTLYVAGRPAPRPEDAPPVLRHYVG